MSVFPLLKSCPFCGNTADFTPDFYCEALFRAISCNACNAAVLTPIISRRIDDDRMRLSEQWNKRTEERRIKEGERADRALIVEAWRYGQFSDSANWQMPKPVRDAMRKLAAAWENEFPPPPKEEPK